MNLACVKPKGETTRMTGWPQVIAPHIRRLLELLAIALALTVGLWVNLLAAQPLGTPATQAADAKPAPLVLTEAEQVWLQEHPVIRVAQDTSWAPVEFADALGEPSGMSADYLKLVEQRLGVKFQQVRELSWFEVMGGLQLREIDMTTSVAATQGNSTFLAFTRPYMQLPIVIFTQMNVSYVADLQMLRGKKVAVGEGYSVSDWIARDHPEIQLINVRNTEEGIARLEGGEVFAYIDNMLVVNYFISLRGDVNARVAGSTPYVNAQSMAVRKDWPVFAGILQKALDSISERERAEIYGKWLPLRTKYRFKSKRVWQGLAMFVVAILGLAAWVRLLYQSIRRRRLAEAVLRESEARYARAVRGSSDGLWEWGVLTNENYLSPLWKDLLGFAPDELTDHSDSFFSRTHPDDVARVQAALKAHLEQQLPYRIELRLRTKSGDYRWFLVRGEAERDEQGRAILMAGAIIDIDERKHMDEQLSAAQAETTRLLEMAEDSREALLSVVEDQQEAEQALRQLNETLERRVAERTADLAAANQELEAFSYSVSHDLRAPLRAIDGFSRKVIERSGARLDDEGRRQLQVVRDGAQRMGRLIDDLLAFSRMGRMEMTLQPVDMAAMARAVAAELRAAEPERAIEFAFSPMPTIQGDAAMLRQLWVNLLGNAIKFSRGRDPARIEVGGRVEGLQALYWVRDNGAGFDMQYAEKLFGVFQRLHRQEEFEGTGVGLAIAQRILHRHGGQIRAQGRLDGGATFSFALPLAGTNQPTSERTAS